jgi:hypothetical protein
MSAHHVSIPDVSQDSQRDSSDDVEDDDVVQPSMEPPLVEGESLPSPTSDLNYRLDGYRDCRVYYTLLDVPQELREIESPFWRMSKFLKKTFRVTNVSPLTNRRFKKEVGLVFPVCLLFGALTLTDRLIVVNWWIHQSKSKMSFHTERLKKFFRCPTKSAELLPLMTSAAGAAEASRRNIRPKAVSPFDSQELRNVFGASTRSNQIIENTRRAKRRDDSEPGAHTSAQMDDQSTRRGIDLLGKRALTLLKRTKNVNRLDENVEIAVVVQQKIRMRTSKRGRVSLDAPMVTKTRIFSRNENAFNSLIDYCNKRDDNTNSITTYTFGDNSDELDESDNAISETIHTNTNDEEDVISSLLRLNQENIAPDSDDEPEWIQHLAD